MSKGRTDSEAEYPRTKALRLEDVLRQLPKRALESLVDRLQIRVDHTKRIDAPAQVARALLMLPEVRDPGRLPGPTRELLYRIAEARGVLLVNEIPPAVEPLVALGIVYARARGSRFELLLPVAFMVQMRCWEGEDPRGVRALLAQSTPEVASSVASHYLGRTATPPLALALEPAWEVLTDLEALRDEVSGLAPLERKLLGSIEEVGGEVDTEELLDLEREPMRLRGATGATPSRRGVGFALERRGFLVPVHPNRHIVPSEVAAIVGAEQRAAREEQRMRIRRYVLAEDHAPHRASFAVDPSPLTLAMALSVRDPATEVRAGVGTPKSLMTRFSSRWGRSPEAVGLLASLSRAAGLWDPSAVNTASPPGSGRIGDLPGLLFETWRRGGAWDEARPDGEVLRAGAEARDASAVGVIREIVLEALAELGDGRWAPWEAIDAYVRADARTPGVTRLLERWGQRAAVEPAPTPDIARRIALETLHCLGVVDIGEPEADDGIGPTLRITPMGRQFLGLTDSAPVSEEKSRFIDNQVLRLGPATSVGECLAVSPFVEIGGVTGALDVSITQQSISLALSAGYEADIIRERLERVAPLPDPIARLLAQVSTVLGRAELVEAVGFLWVADPEVRELLRTRRQTTELFVEPSPPGGLLIAPGVDADRLARRCRLLGVELVIQGAVYRTRSTVPPSRRSGSHKLSSMSLSATTGPKSSGQRRRSSQKLPAAKRK